MSAPAEVASAGAGWISAHFGWIAAQGPERAHILARLAAKPSLLRPDDPFAAASLGLALKSEGHDAAETVFRMLIEAFPRERYGWHELAVIRAEQGRSVEADGLFHRALACQPDDGAIRCNYARHLARTGRRPAARALLEASRPGDRTERAAYGRLLELFAFMDAHPLEDGVARAEALAGGPRYLRAPAIEARVAEALAEGRPLSLIRLGDGEGAWLRMGDEARFPRLYEGARRDFLEAWFGGEAGELDDVGPHFCDLIDAALAGADIIGLPYPSRMEHEYGLVSARGAAACFNILRRAEHLQVERPDCCFATQDIHLDLHQSGALTRLLGDAERVGVITCHADLADRLSRTAGARIVANILLPGEREFRAVLGGGGADQPHYPQAFRRVMRRLQGEDQTGVLWLVAGGFLGKAYCEAIRSRGGVALDIGSLADGWSGRVTRPTLRDLARYQLPESARHV